MLQEEGVCWKLVIPGFVAFYFGLFVVILVMVNVLTSESIMIMIRNSCVLDILLDDRHGH